MGLNDELRGYWKNAFAEFNATEKRLAELAAYLRDLERAIAALEPVEEADAFAAEQDIAAEQLLREEDEVFADAYAVEIISDLTGDPAIEPESGLHGDAVGEDGYAPVTNPEADAIVRAQDWYSPEQIAERERASAKWPGLGTLWGKPKVDA